MSQEAVRVALVGAGSISRSHSRAYLGYPDRIKCVAVCDVNEEAAKSRAEELGVDRVFASFEEALNEAEFDAVDICTTHDQHAPIARAAIAAGKHVLVEKPLGISLAECKELVDAAEAADVVLMAGQCQRYDPGHQAVKRLIDQGELGAIRAARFDSMQNIVKARGPGNWLCDGSISGGGIVIAVSIHLIDLMRYFFGNVRRVTALSSSRPPFRNGAEDYACVLLEFENGVIADHFATYSGYKMPWSEQYTIFGERGTIHSIPPKGKARGNPMIGSENCFDPEGHRLYGGFVPIPASAKPDGLETEDKFVNELLHFARCIREGTEPLSSGRDNLETMKTIFAIYQSAREGRPVELSTLG